MTCLLASEIAWTVSIENLNDCFTFNSPCHIYVWIVSIQQRWDRVK